MSTQSYSGRDNGNGNSNGNGHTKHNGNRHQDDDAIEVNTADDNFPFAIGELPPTESGTVVAGNQILIDENFIPSFTEPHESTEILTGGSEQFSKIQQAVFDLLDAFEVNWEDPNYSDTPKRVAKAYTEFWAQGYGRRPEDEITVFPNSSGSGDLVMVKDMKFYSMCSHHLAPFSGYAAVAYIPDENLLGLSKLGRILDIYAGRFQLQERIGAQTADKLMELIAPQGVMVILYDVEHMCMSSRGVKLHEASTNTVATRGIFKTSSQLRTEVMSMLRR